MYTNPTRNRIESERPPVPAHLRETPSMESSGTGTSFEPGAAVEPLHVALGSLRASGGQPLRVSPISASAFAASLWPRSAAWRNQYRARAASL